jgi:hypothetical protein
MGLFNSGKNDKVEKVSKYERHYNVPPNSSRRRSSKHRSHQDEPAARAMSQPPLMRMGGGGGYYQQPAAVFTPPMVGAMAPNVMPQLRYPMAPFDLSKYPTPGAFSSNPFVGQMPPMNMSPVWNNGMGLVNNRSPFAQPFNDYQQGGWPMMSPSNYGYMPAMQF